MLEIGTIQNLTVVKKVDFDQMSAICTPLAFGVPDLLGLFG